MTMITPSYLGETIEYSSLHACRSTLEDPTFVLFQAGIRRTILWTIAVIPSLARFSHRQVATSNPIIPPPFHR